MRGLIFFISVLYACSVFAAGFANADKSGVMLSGYDPVSYFEAQGVQKGDAKITAKVEERVYWFSSEDHQKKFLKNPGQYEPQFGGWCAYAVADSKSKVDVDPKSFVIQEGKLLVFYNGLWGDTRDKWLHNKSKDPKSYLQQANANWIEVKTKEP